MNPGVNQSMNVMITPPEEDRRDFYNFGEET